MLYRKMLEKQHLNVLGRESSKTKRIYTTLKWCGWGLGTNNEVNKEEKM